ncbi:NAD-dependent epimerase/dehydratase family protein [Massilia sp. 9I]|uniref:NAD-dependent epimerase/dehydratase family protein n=1 Tax=Massilia sp. 9I TaxID=2653152 RepID=UPI0012EF8F19|nr:NAD-dependent epimerase/dehydratase family protein [Massilia sp. 9I]VXB80339.1 Nucleoside-diphosphate-sugar epimerases [Massilia sp. 9I]
MQQQETALVLGANGGIGGEVARQLLAAGWQVRALTRRAAPAAAGAVTWIRGDALVAADVLAAARGCSVIVHAVNPPGYRNWAEQVVPMLEHSIAAAEAVGASILLPGTVYNYGPDAFPLADEDAPQHPETRKGRLRVKMEAELEAWCRRGGRALVVRAGDYFGPRSGNSWFSQGLLKPGRPLTRIANPGSAGVGHQWAYLPDVAAAMVALLARREALAPFARFHLAGHWDPDGSAMADAIRRVAARHGLAVRGSVFPWWLVRLAAPFNETMRELLEMRYLWQRPLRLENARLLAELGAEPHTPLDLAVERTLAGLGCLPLTHPAAAPAPTRADPSFLDL